MKVFRALMGLLGVVLVMIGVLTQDAVAAIVGAYVSLSYRLDELSTLEIKVDTPIRKTEER